MKCHHGVFFVVRLLVAVAYGCGEGWFGENCTKQCVGHCRDNTACNHVTCQCERGCDAGWTGSMCDKECISSYGVNCKDICNIYFINKTCDKINGSCLYGCEDGEQCETDTVTYIISSTSNLNKLPILVGGFGGACALIVVVAMTVFIMRKKSGCTLCQTSVYSLCLGSTPASEENNTENFSNYRELNIPLQENPYQSISRYIISMCKDYIRLYTITAD